MYGFCKVCGRGERGEKLGFATLRGAMGQKNSSASVESNEKEPPFGTNQANQCIGRVVDSLLADKFG